MSTKETRNQSFKEILETLGQRQSDVLKYLSEYEDGATAGELAMAMWEKDVVALPDRNSVHPRLNELVNAGLVQVIDKRKCSVSKKTCSVYSSKSI